MTHRSRLAGFVIDCRAASPSDGAAFWSAVLGAPVTDRAETFETLDTGTGLNVEVQAVGHNSRVHLDVETDDLRAEVARLERLGATPHRDCGSWVVMRAPTGHRSCVVEAHTADFVAKANTWEIEP